MSSNIALYGGKIENIYASFLCDKSGCNSALYNGKNEYNIFDLANVEYVIDEDVDYVTPCYFYKTENEEFRFIQILNNECCMVEAESQKVLAKFKCKSVDNQKLFLVNADEELIPFSTLEDYFDNTLKVATIYLVCLSKS